MSRRNKKSLSKTPIVVKIDAISHEGRGIAHIDGKTVFVQNALPGETVTCQYVKRHRRFDVAAATEISDSSPDRAEPLCPHYHACGGCQFQHASSEFQLEHKQNVLLEQLEHFGHVTPQEIIPPITADIWHYRRKARLGVRFVLKKDALLIGFHEKNGRYIAIIEECPVLCETVGNHIMKLREFVRTLNAFEHIAQIEVAAGDHETALIFRHLIPLDAEDIDKLRQFAKNEDYSIYLQPNDKSSIHKLYPKDDKNYLTYSVDDITIRFHPSDFTQVNAGINRQMVPRAIEWLDPQPNDHVLDLFCGLGNFTLPIAKYCQHVTGVEGDADLIERAKINAEQNHVSHVNFHVANLAEDITQTEWAKCSYNKILLDPPRTGALEILETIHQFKPEKIVYISCNPATLARDAGKLHELGWTLKKIGILDMFPHTSHFESIALFTPNE